MAYFACSATYRRKVVQIAPAEGRALNGAFGYPTVFWREGDRVRFWPWPLIETWLEEPDPYVWIDPFAGLEMDD